MGRVDDLYSSPKAKPTLSAQGRDSERDASISTLFAAAAQAIAGRLGNDTDGRRDAPKGGTMLYLRTLAVVLLLAAPAFAQPGNPDVFVGEDGTGTLVFTLPPPGGSFSTTGVLKADPGPGGLSAALTYDLLGPRDGFVAGDVIFLDRDITTGLSTVSDVIRFNPRGTGGNPNYPDSLVFYSDNEDAFDLVLADTGFPSAFYTNNLTLTELFRGSTCCVYQPNPGEPGFMPTFTAIYHIGSDPDAVPEPGTLLLVGSGVMGLAAIARRRHTRC